MKPVVPGKPTVDTTTQLEDAGGGKIARRQCRKSAVLIIVVLAVLLVGVAGGLAAAYILKEQAPTLERAYIASSDGLNVSVKVAADVKAKIAIFTDGRTTMVREYNKGFTVHAMAVKDGETMCFIRLMDNTTSSFSSVQGFVENSATTLDKSGTPTVDRIVGEKIKDLTFLSSYAQQACDGHDTYWVTPDDNSNGGRGITKRRTCLICVNFPQKRCVRYCDEVVVYDPFWWLKCPQCGFGLPNKEDIVINPAIGYNSNGNPGGNVLSAKVGNSYAPGSN